MALARGTRLGPYQIESPIGAGGMGEVYKAIDTRLERTVAIKVLPAHVASDPERSSPYGGILVVDVTTDPTFTPSQPVSLFDGLGFSGSSPVRSYDLAPDGQQFVMRITGQSDQQPVTSIHIVQNWTQELLERVPVP